jgi:hypothetical protein
MSEEIKTEVKYSSYTPAQKKASQLYRQNNKEKINIQRKRYYQKRKENDPTFLEYKRVKAREYYEKKKLDKVVTPEATPEESKVEVIDTVELLKILSPESPIVKALEKAEEEKPVEPLPELLKEAMTTPLPDEPKKKSKKSKK